MIDFDSEICTREPFTGEKVILAKIHESLTRADTVDSMWFCKVCTHSTTTKFNMLTHVREHHIWAE